MYRKLLNVEIYLTPVSYNDGYLRQQELHRLASSGAGDYLMLLEHSPVYSSGNQEVTSDFLVDLHILRERGAEIVNADRGGRLTFHGPGQIVIYVLINLTSYAHHVRKFINHLEMVITIYLNRRFSIKGRTETKYPGIWVGDAKIAAVGISIHKRTTMHGVALNINTDLSFFNAILPCGIEDGRVCSVESILVSMGIALSSINMAEEMKSIAHIFAEVFGYEQPNIRFN